MAQLPRQFATVVGMPLLRRLGKAPEQLAKIEFKMTLPVDRAAR